MTIKFLSILDRYNNLTIKLNKYINNLFKIRRLYIVNKAKKLGPTLVGPNLIRMGTPINFKYF